MKICTALFNIVDSNLLCSRCVIKVSLDFLSFKFNNDFHNFYNLIKSS